MVNLKFQMKGGSPMKKTLGILALTLLLSGCGFLQDAASEAVHRTFSYCVVENEGAEFTDPDTGDKYRKDLKFYDIVEAKRKGDDVLITLSEPYNNSTQQIYRIKQTHCVETFE